MKKLNPKRSSLSLYFTLLLAVIVVMVLLRNCTKTTWHVNDNRAWGDTLNVAIEISPLGLSTSNDTLSGYYYDLIRTLSREHNRPIKIEAFTHLESALDRLESGRYDIVAGDIPTNTYLRDRFLTTKPIHIDKQVLVQLSDTAGNIRINSQFDLINDTIYVPRNSPFKTRLEHLARELGGPINIVDSHEYGAEQLILLVALGQLDNAVVNKRLAEIIKKDYPRLDCSVEISFNQFQSWLVNRKDSFLCDTLNSWITSFHGSKLEKELESRYL